MRVAGSPLHPWPLAAHTGWRVTRGPAGEHNPEMGNVYLVFDYHPYDLHGVIERMHGHLTLQHIRSFMKQLLEGVHFAHVNNVLHRDLKSALPPADRPGS